jgi:hypothetical protein
MPRGQVLAWGASLAALLALAGCGGARTVPSQPDLGHAAYPGERYLHGRGVGATQRQADQRALAELAAVFEVQVEQSTTVADRYFQLGQVGGQPMTVESTSATDRVSARAGGTLRGAQVVARGPAGDGFQALAVLEKATGAALARDEATAGVRRAAELQARAAAEPQPVAGARLLLARARSLEAAARANRDLRVLGAEPVPAPDTHAAWAELDAWVGQRLPVSLSLDAPDAPRVAEALLAGLTARGLRVVEEAGAAVRLTGSFRLVRVEREPGDWVFVRADLTLSASDAVGARLSSTSLSLDTVSGLTLEQARERALTHTVKHDVPGFLGALLRALLEEPERQPVAP